MKIKCPHCGVEFDFEEGLYGKYAECLSCGKKFIIGQTAIANQKEAGKDNDRNLTGCSKHIWFVFKAIVAFWLWGNWLMYVMCVCWTYSSASTAGSELISIASFVRFFVAVWFTKYCVK